MEINNINTQFTIEQKARLINIRRKTGEKSWRSFIINAAEAYSKLEESNYNFENAKHPDLSA